MKIATLFADDNEAVSPVIGVILMVAITVILAAVIGTFVLGQADQLNENAPTTDFDYEGSSGNPYEVIHAGGDDFEDSNVEVQYIDGASTSQTDQWVDNGTSTSGTVTAGDTLTTSTNVGAGETIRVLWASAEGGSSSTIGEYEVPS